jgi:hypothetical protein
MAGDFGRGEDGGVLPFQAAESTGQPATQQFSLTINKGGK